jgi:hypothetical protein
MSHKKPPQTPKTPKTASQAQKPGKADSTPAKKQGKPKPAPMAHSSKPSPGPTNQATLPGGSNSRDKAGKKQAPFYPGGSPPDSGGLDPAKPLGPGNPPRSGMFKKGKSGNPKGYPKGQLNASTIIKYWLGQKEVIENPITGKIERLTQTDIVTLTTIAHARKGNMAAVRELLDRTEGKPVQSTKLLNASDKLLEVMVGFAPPTNHQPAPPAEKKKGGKNGNSK